MSNCTRKNGHTIIDVYDEKEEIPIDIINSASHYHSGESEAMVLQAGKLKTKKYVLSYCKDCGLKIEKTCTE